MWIQHQDCRRLVAETWVTQVIGCPISVLVGIKLNILKLDFKIWNKDSFGDVHRMVEMVQAELDIIQHEMDITCFTEALQKVGLLSYKCWLSKKIFRGTN